jgi:hypothetical protein
MALVILSICVAVGLIGLFLIVLKTSQRDFVSFGGVIGVSFLLSSIAFGTPAYLGYTHPGANLLALLGIGASIMLCAIFAGCTLFFYAVPKKVDQVVGFALMTGITFYALTYLISLI